MAADETLTEQCSHAADAINPVAIDAPVAEHQHEPSQQASFIRRRM
jgi:hypothetical protein